MEDHSEGIQVVCLHRGRCERRRSRILLVVLLLAEKHHLLRYISTVGRFGRRLGSKKRNKVCMYVLTISGYFRLSIPDSNARKTSEQSRERNQLLLNYPFGRSLRLVGDARIDKKTRK